MQPVIVLTALLIVSPFRGISNLSPDSPNVNLICKPVNAAWYTPPQRFQWQWQIDQEKVPRVAQDAYAVTTTYPDGTVITKGTQVDMLLYDVDIETTPAQIATIKSWGAKVACYFEAGTWVKTRPWAAKFPKTALGYPYEPPYTNELWVNPLDPTVRAIIKNTIYPYAKARGCDLVEPDNVQGFERDSYCTGFEAKTGANCGSCKSGTTRDYYIDKKCVADYDAWLDFNKFLATEAHNQGMGVALKNNHFQAAELVDYHDYVLSEQCTSYASTYSNGTIIGSNLFGATANDCYGYLPFLEAGKAVTLTEYSDAEYPMTTGKLCKAAKVYLPYGGFNSILKKTDLTAKPRSACCGVLPCGVGKVGSSVV
ncbi:UNVERIFIED_CONTAM: hypothetical protein HDU68_000131 [Siphonaria sp. JEL0065]|nr:hypothetical protein HDU68_000131 [Siphonaria sp. JEL0065]